jgi:short-subunit dehydrogenase
VAAECNAAEVVVADLGKPDAARELWRAATATGPIEILVNNAGFGYFRAFTGIDWARDAELLQLNITSLVELSRHFVDARGDASGRGYLVNIASIAAYQSVPNFAVYAASKAFVRNFTEALHDELRGSATSATCICPGGTTTEFHAMAGAGDYGWLANKSMLSPEAVAAITIRAMRRGKRTVIPGVLNKLSCFGVRFVPRRFASWMARRVLGKPRPGALPARSVVK